MSEILLAKRHIDQKFLAVRHYAQAMSAEIDARIHRNELGLRVRRLGLPTDPIPLERKPEKFDVKADVRPSIYLVKRSPSQG
jgi:hypothetical protein